MGSDNRAQTLEQDDPNHVIHLQRFPSLYIRTNTPKGRGVFTSAPIPKGTIVETSPILLFTTSENKDHISQTHLQHYTYNWPTPSPSQPAQPALPPPSTSPTPSPKDPQTPPPLRPPPTTTSQALILGLGSMFNHRGGGEQNLSWQRDVEKGMVRYFALREIAVGEELCISYGDRLTFVDADADAARGGEGELEGPEEVLGRIEV